MEGLKIENGINEEITAEEIIINNIDDSGEVILSNEVALPEIYTLVENNHVEMLDFFTLSLFFITIAAGALIALGLWGVHVND